MRSRASFLLSAAAGIGFGTAAVVSAVAAAGAWSSVAVRPLPESVPVASQRVDEVVLSSIAGHSPATAVSSRGFAPVVRQASTDALTPTEDSPIDDVAEVIYSGPRTRPRVALTFDDGPSGGNTGQILSVLARLDARATFFVEGRRVERSPRLARRIVAEGHQIANHAYSHRSFRSLFRSEIDRELESTQRAIEVATGRVPTAMRPPFGRFPESSRAVIGEQGMRIVLWNVDSGDWHGEPREIVRTVLRQVEPGSIVLLHDRKPQTAIALPDLIEGLRARGFDLVTVDELLDGSIDRSVATDDPPLPTSPVTTAADAVQAVAIAAGIWAVPPLSATAEPAELATGRSDEVSRGQPKPGGAG